MEFAPRKSEKNNNEVSTIKHLENGFKPITICSADQNTHFDNRMEIESPQDIYLADLIESAEDINFKNPALEKNILTQGPYTYVISELSETPKKSLGYINCTGLVATGIDDKTGNNISFISHQEPRRIKDMFPREFKQDLLLRLGELKERSIAGSLDIVIVGGNDVPEKEGTTQNYTNTINILSGIIEEKVNMKPVIAMGPKEKIGQDSIIYDTQKRNLYVSKTAGLDMNQSAHFPE